MDYFSFIQTNRTEICCLVGGFLLGKAIFNSYDKWVESQKPKPNEIKFVRFTNKMCKAHVFSKLVCSKRFERIDHTFECAFSIIQWMEEFFDSAQETLDIAIYLVTCEAFRDAIMRAWERGIKIRIIADLMMAKGSGSAIPIFIRAGIPLRMLDTSRMMHRKSAIVDRKRVLMGSGNWTMQALAGNWDFWYQTSDRNIVDRYVSAFEDQWAIRELMQPTFAEFEAIKIHK